jgi:uncharacterized protein (TIGR03382 family)
MLCASMPFTAAGPDTTQVTFAWKTANNGNDDRNAHNMKMSTFIGHDGAEKVLLKYGYQPDNHTENYLQVVDSSLQTLMPQTLQYAQNNDNCNANIDNYKLIESTATSARFFGGVECNGNGNDDGGSSLFRITFQNGNYQLVNDVDYLQTEADVERWRPYHALAVDPATGGQLLVQCGAAGNTNPPNKGARCYMLQQNGNDLNLLARGYAARRDGNLYYQDPKPNIYPGTNAGFVTYVMADTTGRGNNKTKARTTMVYRAFQVTQANGIEFTGEQLALPSDKTDLAHPAQCGLTFGTGPNATFGMALYNGTIAGSPSATAQIEMFTLENGLLVRKDEGVFATGVDNAHLQNFYGQNPDDQGREFLTCREIQNPFFGDPAAQLRLNGQMTSTTDVQSFLLIPYGARHMRDRDGAGPEGITIDEKLSMNFAIIPASRAATVPPPGTPDPTSQLPQPIDNPDPTVISNPITPGGTALGGCSTSGNSSGMATLALLGLALIIIRRRRS